MLDSNRVHEVLIDICQSVTTKRNGGFNARCPVCGDSNKSFRKKRLHINWYQKYNNWMCTCFNGGCEFHAGSIYSLYSKVKGVSINQAKNEIDRSIYDTDQIKNRLYKRSNIPDNFSEKKNILDLSVDDYISADQEVSGCILPRYQHILKEFLEKRHISKKCYIAHSGRYKGRIIVPIYLNNDLVYFQGRSIDPLITPKYLNPELDKSSIIMNSDVFDPNKYIIVTEGIIDAWMVENNQGTSVLGSRFDDDFIAKLLKMTDKGVILCFDNPLIDDAGRKEIISFIQNSQYKDRVRYFLPDRKDFKDLNELKIIFHGSIYDYIIENSFSSLNIKVKLSLIL